mgnify:CR=1 FL=1
MKKLRSTTPVSISSKRLFIIAVSVVALGLIAPIQLAVTNVSADDYDARIRALEQDIARYDAAAAELSTQADTLQREVSRLNNEKATIQAQIDISQAKLNQLNAEIKSNEEKIAKNKTNAEVFKFTAKNVPTKTPSTIKIPKVLTILKSTASYSICVFVEIIDVGIIIAREVPTDKCILVTMSKSRTLNA